MYNLGSGNDSFKYWGEYWLEKKKTRYATHSTEI